jgi:hypothetical protein
VHVFVDICNTFVRIASRRQFRIARARRFTRSRPSGQRCRPRSWRRYLCSSDRFDLDRALPHSCPGEMNVFVGSGLTIGRRCNCRACGIEVLGAIPGLERYIWTGRRSVLGLGDPRSRRTRTEPPKWLGEPTSAGVPTFRRMAPPARREYVGGLKPGCTSYFCFLFPPEWRIRALHRISRRCTMSIVKAFSIDQVACRPSI